MRLKVVAALFVALCFFSFIPGCIDLPEYEEPETGLPTGVSTPAPVTPTPTIYVQNQTPFPTPTEEPVVSTMQNFSPAPYTQKSTYTEIYNESLDMKYNVVAFSYDLTHPPMVIKYEVVPVNTTYERYLTNPFGSKEWESASVDTFNPNAWAEIKVIDKDTGEVVKAGGYRGEYFDNLKGDINVNTIGDYQVEIRGNLLTIDVSILVGGVDEGVT